jgi:hypothetical protein
MSGTAFAWRIDLSHFVHEQPKGLVDDLHGSACPWNDNHDGH